MVGAIHMVPARLTSPRDGINPSTPLSAAGISTEPLASVPRPRGA